MIKNITHSLVFFFLFTGIFSYSQSITGKISDKEGNPISYAEITISKDNKLSEVSISDENGNFNLKVSENGNYQLAILKDGNNVFDKTISINGDVVENIQIFRKNEELIQEVVVSGKKKLIERKVDRIVFNVENSISSTGGDGIDALKITPGIRVQNSKISMIGKSGMAVMIDDKLVQLSGDDLINYLKTISSDNIKSIEVITTPPAKYDAEGNSGLINIKLKAVKLNQWNASLKSSYIQSTYPKSSIGGNFNYQKNRFSLYSNLIYVNGSNAPIEINKIYYDTGLWNEESKRRDFQKSLAARIGINYKITDNWNIGIQYLGNTNKPSINENILTTIFNPDNATENSFIKTISESKNQNNNHSINLNSDVQLDSLGRKMMVNFDYFRYKNNENRNFNTIDLLSANNTSEQNIENYSTKIDFEHPFPWIDLTYGAKISFIKTNSDVNYFDTTTGLPIFDATQSNVFQYKENTQSLYISGTKKITDNWETQLGFRLENTQTQGFSLALNQKNKNNYTKIFPTFYITYTPNENNSISLNYNKRINRPSYNKLNPFRWYSNPYSYVEGNPFLQPSFANNLELNYTLNDNWSNSLYFSHTKNGFEQLTIVDNNTNIQRTVAENFFNTSIIGFSESYTFNKLKWLSNTLSFDWSYNWSKSLIPITNQNLEGSNAYFSINNDFVLNKSKTLLFNISYWYNFKGVSDLDKSNAYSQLDTSLKYLALDKKLLISLNVNDILKTNKPIYTSFTNNTRIDYKNYYDLRSFRITISYAFGNKNIDVERKELGNKEEKERTN